LPIKAILLFAKFSYVSSGTNCRPSIYLNRFPPKYHDLYTF